MPTGSTAEPPTADRHRQASDSFTCFVLGLISLARGAWREPAEPEKDVARAPLDPLPADLLR